MVKVGSKIVQVDVCRSIQMAKVGSKFAQVGLCTVGADYLMKAVNMFM